LLWFLTFAESGPFLCARSKRASKWGLCPILSAAIQTVYVDYPDAGSRKTGCAENSTRPMPQWQGRSRVLVLKARSSRSDSRRASQNLVRGPEILARLKERPPRANESRYNRLTQPRRGVPCNYGGFCSAVSCFHPTCMPVTRSWANGLACPRKATALAGLSKDKTPHRGSWFPIDFLHASGSASDKRIFSSFFVLMCCSSDFALLQRGIAHDDYSQRV